MKIYIFTFTCILTGCATVETPESMTTVTGANTKQRADYNRLKAGTRGHLPKGLNTIKQAGDFLLQPAGYTVIGPTSITAAPRGKLSQGELQSLENALLAIGNGRQLVVDHRERTVTFAPREANGPNIIETGSTPPQPVAAKAPAVAETVPASSQFGTF